MKKIIALLLVAVMCLSFVACGNNADKENTGNNAETNNTQVSDKKAEAEKAILGTWERKVDNVTITFTFNSDNTCVWKTDLDEYKEEKYNWKYDEELDCYMLVTVKNTPVTCGFILNENGNSYLSYGQDKYYRQDNSK